MKFFRGKEKKEAEKTPEVKKAPVPVKKVAAKKQEKRSEKKKGVPLYKKEKHILVRPLITEKVTALEGNNQYVFAVESPVNKIEIQEEIKKIYDVKPIKVNIITVRGKKVRFGRTQGTRKKWKKAIVFLKEGDSINVTKGSKS